MTGHEGQKTIGILEWLVLGFTSSLVAGGILGVLEAVYVLLGAHSGDWMVIPYGVVLNGLIAAACGIGYGAAGWILATVLGKPWKDRDGVWAALFSMNFVILFFIVFRHFVMRDLFLERLRTGEPGGIALHAALLFSSILLFFLFKAMVGSAMERIHLSRLRSRNGGAIALYAAILAATGAIGYASALIPVKSPGPFPSAFLRDGDPRPNIILIVIDTQRADHLSCYGYPKPVSPNIDRLASEGVLFKYAIAQASWTKPSIASVLCSMYPSSHRAIHKKSILPDEAITLGETLEVKGYTTAGLANNRNITSAFNFGQGFESYEFLEPDYLFGASEMSSHLAFYSILRVFNARILSNAHHVHQYYQDARVVTDRAISWMADHKKGRFFLFVQYMDPHGPYFHHPYDGRCYTRILTPSPPPETADALRKAYEGEVAFCDAHIGRLLDWLRDTGLYENTMIVLTGDHGEEFFEHGGWWHGTTLYEEQIHIPLIIKPGNLALAGTIVNRPVRHIDIAPTVLDSIGEGIPKIWQGSPLFAEKSSEDDVGDPVFSEEEFEGNVIRSITSMGRKLIVAGEDSPRGLRPVEFYDLEADPGERRDLSGAGGVESTILSLRTTLESLETFANRHNLEGAGAQDQ